MIVIGLTGGSGVGKGCVCQKFLKHGVPSIDTDKTARQVCDIGKPCLRELVSTFGSSILNPDGSLNRKELAAIAFSDKEKHGTLNRITHFYILNEVRHWLAQQQKNGCIAAIVDAPLLFESGFDKECDLVVAVVADRSIRIERILARDGITLEQAELRLSKQYDDAFYTDRAQYVITNNGSPDLLDKQIQDIYDSFTNLNKV